MFDFPLRTLSLLFLCTLVSACAAPKDGNQTIAPESERVAVIIGQDKPTVSENLSDFSLSLPEPSRIDRWSQNGGTVTHAVGNSALNGDVVEVWAETVGKGSGRRFKLLSQPIVNKGRVYTMDAVGRISSFDLKTGEKFWRAETTPSYRDSAAMGGGLAIDQDVIYATTGFGEVIALDAEMGKVMWRRFVGKPIRSAPTIFEGRVFVITIENETYALDAGKGFILWRHSGIAESAALMGASSPAIVDDTVVVAYSSGELFALRAQNGRVIWGDVLSVPMTKGALPAIADIRGLPVIDHGIVYAISHSGRMIAINLRTGEHVFEADLGSFNTPCVVGNAIYIVSNDNQLIAMTKDNGKIFWITDMPKVEDNESRKARPLVYSGPVMAGNQLWLTNSIGHLETYDAEDGKLISSKEVASPFYLPPIVADESMLLLSDDGRIRAFK